MYLHRRVYVYESSEWVYVDEGLRHLELSWLSHAAMWCSPTRASYLTLALLPDFNLIFSS